MNDILRSPVAASAITAVYEKNGHYFPYDVTSEAKAAGLLADLEAAEAEVGDDRARRNAEMKREILYKGVKSGLVKVNRRA